VIISNNLLDVTFLVDESILRGSTVFHILEMISLTLNCIFIRLVLSQSTAAPVTSDLNQIAPLDPETQAVANTVGEGLEIIVSRLEVNPNNKTESTIPPDELGGLGASCLQNNECKQGYLCGIITRKCIYAFELGRLLCESDANCEQGFKCNTSTRNCEESVVEWPSNPNWGVSKCETHTDCQKGYLCDGTNTCFYSLDGSGVCTNNSDCLNSNICNSITKTCTLPIDTLENTETGMAIIITVLSIICLITVLWWKAAITIMYRQYKLKKEIESNTSKI
jgi:hypothetical protein